MASLISQSLSPGFMRDPILKKEKIRIIEGHGCQFWLPQHMHTHMHNRRHSMHTCIHAGVHML